MGTAPVTRDIALPPTEVHTLAQLSPSSPVEYVLYVRGIEVPKDGQAMFNVFLNLPDATAATSTESRELRRHRHRPGQDQVSFSACARDDERGV